MDFFIYLGRYLTNIFSLVSVILNVVIFFGSPSESLSERCGRHYVEMTSPFYGIFMRMVIDGIFFWQKDHCRRMYELEITGDVFRSLSEF